MKILPIFAYNPLNIKQTQSKNTDSSLLPGVTLPSELQADTISFSGGRGSAKNAEPLRALLQYGIPDLYSDIILMDPEVLKNFDSRRTFSKSIKTIIKIVKSYEKSLFNVEKQFLEIVKRFAKTNPDYTLSDVVRSVGQEHNKKLLAVQQPIFDDLTTLAKEMPLEQLIKYKEMMDIVYKRLHCEPIKLPFNAREFIYKLQRIADENAVKDNTYEEMIMLNIIRMAKRMPRKKISGKKDSEISRAKKQKRNKNDRLLVKKRTELLSHIEILVNNTTLKNNKELSVLLSQTRARINNIPLIIPFNRRSFIHDLKKITDTLEDQKLAHKMIQIAEQLPTSHDNISAFIVKRLDYSSDKIGHDMFSGSLGCIDHRVPKVKNGPDAIENYCLCSSYHNSERAERSIAQQLRKFPDTYTAAQRQMDKLIELYNNGTFRRVKLPRHYLIIHKKRMKELSPPERPLVLNIDKLK